VSPNEERVLARIPEPFERAHGSIAPPADGRSKLDD
jgi:hypothetical protein